MSLFGPPKRPETTNKEHKKMKRKGNRMEHRKIPSTLRRVIMKSKNCVLCCDCGGEHVFNAF